MIRSFRHKGLRELFQNGVSKRVSADLQQRCLDRLDVLNEAMRPEEMNLPGWNFHALHRKPKCYTVHVNGPWCITFGWEGEDAVHVDLENYHS